MENAEFDRMTPCEVEVCEALECKFVLEDGQICAAPLDPDRHFVLWNDIVGWEVCDEHATGYRDILKEML